MVSPSRQEIALFYGNPEVVSFRQVRPILAQFAKSLVASIFNKPDL
jgi:hypothetical protein